MNVTIDVEINQWTNLKVPELLVGSWFFLLGVCVPPEVENFPPTVLPEVYGEHTRQKAVVSCLHTIPASCYHNLFHPFRVCHCLDYLLKK